MHFGLLTAFLLAVAGSWVLLPWVTFRPVVLVARPHLAPTTPPVRRRMHRIRRAPDSPDH